jgi:hypothetical protein
MSKILFSPRKSVNKTTQSPKTNQHSFWSVLSASTSSLVKTSQNISLIFRDVFKSSYIEDITRRREDMTFTFEW